MGKLGGTIEETWSQDAWSLGCTYRTPKLLVCLKPPSLEAFQKFSMEPEIIATSAYDTAEVKIAMSIEESMKMLQQAK